MGHNGGSRINGGGPDDGGGSGSDITETYYQKMIEANPGNPLLLGNYAKFLKEVKGDFDKVEEYCGRAILANPNDGNVLSFYADLIWQNQKDAPRAQTFDQAVKTSPDDSFVLASYAKFLWDAEEEDEEKEHTDGEEQSHFLPSHFLHQTLTAA